MWGTSSLSKEELRGRLMKYFTNMKPVGSAFGNQREKTESAPTFEDLELQAEAQGRDIEAVMQDECKMFYKAISNDGERFYEMQNPAIQEYQIRTGREVVRMIPREIGCYRELKNQKLVEVEETGGVPSRADLS